VTTAERIAELVTPVLGAAGHTLYDVELTGATVRILVDGASLDALERVSREVSDLLDGHDDLMPARWYLEVSSPGLERPLRRPDHFRGAVGTQVKIKTTADVEGERRIDGVIEAADDGGITVAGRRLAYGQIERARTVFEWGTPAARTRRVS